MHTNNNVKQVCVCVCVPNYVCHCGGNEQLTTEGHGGGGDRRHSWTFDTVMKSSLYIRGSSSGDRELRFTAEFLLQTESSSDVGADDGTDQNSQAFLRNSDSSVHRRL